MAKGITQIIVANDLGGTPARTHRPTGVVWVCAQLIGQYPPNQGMNLYQFMEWVKGKGSLSEEKWYFILKHEEAHIKFDTKDEVFCDQYASREFLKKYNKPSQSVRALTDVMPMSNREQVMRGINQIERAAEHDCYKNNNSKACEINTMIKVSPYSMSKYYSNFVPQATPECWTTFDVSSCMFQCKQSFPNGPINQKKCIDACVKKDQATQQLNSTCLTSVYDDKKVQVGLQQSTISANALTAPELAQINAELEIARQKAAQPQVFTSKNIVPIALGLAVAVLVIFLIRD